MKHYLLSAVLIASVMFFASCDKYDEPEHSILTTTDAEPCKTLQDVKKFNERLMANPPISRSSVDKRCMIKADMMGAIYGIGLIDSTSDFNDSDFLADNPLLTERANDIFKQFMIAFDVVPASTSHITSIVNNYIRIIETNNELSRAERIQLYTGLIVAVYSCEFWKNKLKPALSF